MRLPPRVLAPDFHLKVDQKGDGYRYLFANFRQNPA